jgi:hypothetical protein
MNILTSFTEANMEFVKQFIDFQSKQINLVDYAGNVVSVATTSGSKSALNRTELKKEDYPILSIQSGNPKHLQQYVRENDRRVFSSGDVEQIRTFVRYNPIPFELSYVVSFACLNQLQVEAFQTWFYKTFEVPNKNFFLYLPKTVSLNDAFMEAPQVLGQHVSYSYEEEVFGAERKDGILETVVTFTVGPVFIALHDDKEVDIINKIVVTLNNNPAFEVDL